MLRGGEEKGEVLEVRENSQDSRGDWPACWRGLR